MVRLLLPKGEETARGILHKATQEGRHVLIEPEAKAVLEAFDIPTTRYSLVTSMAEAIKEASVIGYPVVLKIVSPDISHKTDIGGVKINIQNEEAVETAYNEIMHKVKKKLPKAGIAGILVEEMASPSTEVIIGGLQDRQFGPSVMFGIGGIFVEVFKDVSFRIAPVEEYEAHDMIAEVKGSKLLRGFRGAEALDIPALSQTIIQVSNIMVSFEEIQEVDLNPILVYKKGLKTVDARIILRKQS